MKIYTKTGDKGTTSLLGGERVFKDDQRLNAYGTVDELNSLLGLAAAEIENPELLEVLRGIQAELFEVGVDLATPADSKVKIDRFDTAKAERLESLIDKFEERLPVLKNFILPGGSRAGALLHYARTVCRRAERETAALMKTVEIKNPVLVYLNRLSDLLFVLARYCNKIDGAPEIIWKK
ncbi:ATP:cob(I)alamin adenosyltransferase, putative [Melioribacter roseus P3M-2]|uniref:Corrinoid adenosyltransferase n=1 Tax=Melioribacter roseus (strain DSM 23840 / JCM 17771 / VKM B-2668 / P3M-2) TaxID=1191523 RepID=I6YSI7_MELRP|nr:cob(I)yrinic acid a,c-diamide adenosyltransferase [Melioribacter roseus]AFN73492.1 ATP:cob(I)alamin adenosyltransferase, putative [Melioribacter roseus P3M-2]